jgi:hypothetical protein
MAFSYAKTVTVDHTKCASADSTDFPMLFNSTVAHFKTVANGGRVQNSNGYDIVFCSDASLVNKLDYEVEKYDATSGLLVAHVRIPTLTHSTDKVFYIGYGDSSISTFQGNITGTWASKYKCVLHGGDGTTINVNDSTSNANNFTNSNATASSGQVYGAMHFNGTNAKVTKSGLQIPQTDGTATCWWKPNVGSANNRIAFGVYNASPLRLFEMQPYSDGHWYFGWYDNGNDKRANWTESGISSGTWYKITVTWQNGSFTVLQVNASTVASTNSLNAIWSTTGVTSALGWDESANAFANVDIDEFRITNVAETQDWMTTEYNNQNSPSTFYSLADITVFAAGQYFPPAF